MPRFLQEEAAHPDRAVSHPQGVSTYADKLHDDLVRRRIDLGQRFAGRISRFGRNPDESFPGRNIAAYAGDVGLNSRDHFICRWVDPRNTSIALIEDPDSTLANGEEMRPWSDLSLRGHLMG